MTTRPARITTYYKIQRWEARSFAWKDVQRAHSSTDAAVAAAPAGERGVAWRIMEISDAGRRPV
jgi:hypothetical protein